MLLQLFTVYHLLNFTLCSMRKATIDDGQLTLC
jgi:hypothetical protein